MTIKNILQEYLKRHKYDGLCNPYAECGCDIDDLMPFECAGECKPAYKHECESCPIHKKMGDDGDYLCGLWLDYNSGGCYSTDQYKGGQENA